jgi:MFS family permease
MSTSDPNRILSRYNLLSLYLPSLTLAMGLGIVLPALPVFAAQFGVSFGVASMVLIVNALGSLVAGLPTGFLIDHFGRRRVTLAGPVVTAISAFLCVIAQSFPELLAYRFVGGIGMQMWLLARMTSIADTARNNQRGRMVTSMFSMQSVGSILGPLLGAFLAQQWDVRVPFAVYGVLSLLAIIPSFKLVRETAPVPAAAPAAGPSAAGAPSAAPGERSWAWLLALPLPLLMFLVAQFLASITRGTLFTGSLNLYAVYEYGVGATEVGLLATAATVVGIPITLLCGAIMDRYGRKATIVPGFTLLGIALLVMAVAVSMGLGFEVWIVVFILVNAAMTITSGNMQTLGADLAPSNVRGRFFGLWQTINQSGAVLSPTIFAILTDNVNNSIGFVFLAITSLGVALTIATQVPDPIRDQRRQARQAAAAAQTVPSPAGRG